MLVLRRPAVWSAALLMAALAGACTGDGTPAGPRDASVPDVGPPRGGGIVTTLPDGGQDCEQWLPAAFPSSFMATGQPCLECHDRPMGSAEGMTVAGTVFDRLRTADGCQGVEDVRIVVSDAEGRTIELHSNFAGNFYTSREVAFPITARLEVDGWVRRMGVRVDHGDCNRCHTAGGAEMAPGRIVTPAPP